jgi:hypothetical protein
MVGVDYSEDNDPYKEKSMTSIKKHNETPNSNQMRTIHNNKVMVGANYC